MALRIGIWCLPLASAFEQYGINVITHMAEHVLKGNGRAEALIRHDIGM